MTPDTSILEKLLVAETAAERHGFVNTKRALSELIVAERRSLLARGAGFDTAQKGDVRPMCQAFSKRALGDC